MPYDKPLKTSIGKLSNVILDKINQQIQLITRVNQWYDTLSVIEWFINLEDKERLSFMVFKIENFYLSINESLFTKGIQFTK